MTKLIPISFLGSFLMVGQVQAAGSDTITDFTPVCIGSPVSFAAETTGANALITNPSHYYGALGSAPSPAWFYFKVKDAGMLNSLRTTLQVWMLMGRSGDRLTIFLIF